MENAIRKLENSANIDSDKVRPFMEFERHTAARGTVYINDLIEAIKNENSLRITYQPYTQPQPSERIVHPYLLKEFRNRWFLLGREGNANRITNYALDRIKKIKPSAAEFVANDFFDPIEYFKHLIGVSVPENGRPEEVKIKVQPQAVPYIRSKPIHSNQVEVKEFKNGVVDIKLKLIVNYELKSMLLSYGDGIEVKKPKALREQMEELTKKMYMIYR